MAVANERANRTTLLKVNSWPDDPSTSTRVRDQVQCVHKPSGKVHTLPLPRGNRDKRTRHCAVPEVRGGQAGVQSQNGPDTQRRDVYKYHGIGLQYKKLQVEATTLAKALSEFLAHVARKHIQYNKIDRIASVAHSLGGRLLTKGARSFRHM